MRRLLYIILFLLCLFSCKKENVQTEHLVDSTIKMYKNKLPEKIIFYREKNNSHIEDSNNYIFLDAKGLLERKDENFLILNIEESKELKSVEILSYETGEIFTCNLDNKGKLLSKDVIQTKLDESKPYYIYYEILKRKYPNYMNWDLFPIPKDSLK